MIWEDAAPRDAVSSEAFRLLVTLADEESDAENTTSASGEESDAA